LDSPILYVFGLYLFLCFSFLPRRCPILPEHGWSNKLIQAHESGNLEELITFHESFNSFFENLGITKPFDTDNLANNQGNIVHNFLLLSLTSLGFKNFPMTSFSHTKSFCTSLLSLATGRGSLRNGRLPTLISRLFPLLNAIYDNQSDEIILSSNPSGHPSQSITFRQPNARFSHYKRFCYLLRARKTCGKSKKSLVQFTLAYRVSTNLAGECVVILNDVIMQERG
jgi:hypothetical protein